ncbi:MAG TPA: flagellar assembly protein FliW, partial [Firmicutes bacterium]|nr:flagellar assembly protein FliW [Bacillota bacterium]
MKLYSRRFGELIVPPEKVIRFERGIVGFPEYRRFSLVDVEETSPFLWLVCLD